MDQFGRRTRSTPNLATNQKAQDLSHVQGHGVPIITLGEKKSEDRLVAVTSSMDIIPSVTTLIPIPLIKSNTGTSAVPSENTIRRFTTKWESESIAALNLELKRQGGQVQVGAGSDKTAQVEQNQEKGQPQPSSSKKENQGSLKLDPNQLKDFNDKIQELLLQMKGLVAPLYDTCLQYRAAFGIQDNPNDAEPTVGTSDDKKSKDGKDEPKGSK